MTMLTISAIALASTLPFAHVRAVDGFDRTRTLDARTLLVPTWDTACTGCTPTAGGPDFPVYSVTDITLPSGAVYEAAWTFQINAEEPSTNCEKMGTGMCGEAGCSVTAEASVAVRFTHYSGPTHTASELLAHLDLTVTGPEDCEESVTSLTGDYCEATISKGCGMAKVEGEWTVSTDAYPDSSTLWVTLECPACEGTVPPLQAKVDVLLQQDEVSSAGSSVGSSVGSSAGCDGCAENLEETPEEDTTTQVLLLLDGGYSKFKVSYTLSIESQEPQNNCADQEQGNCGSADCEAAVEAHVEVSVDYISGFPYSPQYVIAQLGLRLSGPDGCSVDITEPNGNYCPKTLVADCGAVEPSEATYVLMNSPGKFQTKILRLSCAACEGTVSSF